MGQSILDAVRTSSDPAAYLDRLPPALRDACLQQLWLARARPEQVAPLGTWTHWWIIAGRGFGKTLAGANFINDRVRYTKVAQACLIGATAADVRDVMVEGPSGILSQAEPDFMPHYEPSKRRITWPNGTVALLYSADEPERLRGPQFDLAWCDEPGAWRRGAETRDMFLMGFRLGQHPQACWTTTPRNVPVVRDAIARATTSDAVVITRGTTFDNFQNLAPSFKEEILAQYEGTRLGRQELYAELLDDMGSIFHRSWFKYREPDTHYHRSATVRFWDLAATPAGEGNEDPDYTVGALVSYDATTRAYTVEDIRRVRDTAGGVAQLIRATAEVDGRNVRIGIEQEPGSAGKAVVSHYRNEVLPGYMVNADRPELFRPSGPKEARAMLLAGPAEQGNVYLNRATWNLSFLDECEEFPVGGHDDQVDAVAFACNWLRTLAGGSMAATAGPDAERTPSAWSMGTRTSTHALPTADSYDLLPSDDLEPAGAVMRPFGV